MNTPSVNEGMVSMARDDFEELLERAAEPGAWHALHGVGLDAANAAQDIRELRTLLDAFNEAKKTAGLTIVRMLVTGLVMALLAGSDIAEQNEATGHLPAFGNGLGLLSDACAQHIVDGNGETRGALFGAPRRKAWALFN